MKRKLILITRYPEPGKCKTRLAAFIGEINAADIQKMLTLDILQTFRKYVAGSDPDCVIEIYYTGSTENQMRALCGEALYKEQPKGDLGKKLEYAFGSSFEEGFDQVVITGSDIPELTPEIIASSFSGLGENDIVIGPAYDGGYYLLGMKKYHSSLFSSNISWGESNVLKSTMLEAKRNLLTAGILKKLHDIDRPEDLFIIKDMLSEALPDPLISVIIPTLNEENNISLCLEQFKGKKNIEVIVADGGSTDGTLQAAEKYGHTLLRTAKRRAVQQNAGAEVAKSSILLFLHADTVLPKGFEREVLRTLSKKNISCGAFKISIAGKRRFLSAVSFLINLRSILFGMPYGDQALFMTKPKFKELKGFKNLSIMEDYDLVSRSKKTGRIRISGKKVVTSDRRWERLGIMKTFLINQKMKILFRLGTDTKKLCRIYYN
jgi:uncharacterized protein